MNKKIRTIAFQVDDQDFIAQYEARVKESGLSVKNYFVSLIKTDIMMSRLQTDSPAQDNGIKEDAPQMEQAHDMRSHQASEAPVYTDNNEQMNESPVPVENPVQSEYTLQQEAVAPAGDTVHGRIVETDTPEHEQSGDPESKQAAPEATEPEEMMNLFVKITKDQREALEYHKNETGETVGNVLNRLIGGFLDDVRNGNLSEEFEETFKYYSDIVKSCDTTSSAKIPTKTNQELTDYVNSIGGSRNALMASLVHMELNGQEMTQDQGMTM